MSVSAPVLRRLALIRYLHGVALAQSRQPEPLCCVSVLTFHDAVEWFLQLAADHLNANVAANQQFMDYWTILGKLSPPVMLGQKGSMLRLNKARVGLKHHGVEPNRESIEAFRVHVKEFLDHNTPMIFGVSFDSVNLSILVHNDEARTRLDSATQRAEEGDRLGAMDDAALAFHLLVEEFEAAVVDRDGSPFPLWRSLVEVVRSPIGGDPVTQAFNDLVDSMSKIEVAVTVLSLGLDYRRYARFNSLTPAVFKTWGGERTIVRDGRVEDRSREEVDFCIDFVVETAVRLQDLVASV